MPITIEPLGFVPAGTSVSATSSPSCQVSPITTSVSPARSSIGTAMTLGRGDIGVAVAAAGIHWQPLVVTATIVAITQMKFDDVVLREVVRRVSLTRTRVGRIGVTASSGTLE
jgi:hypothetical protein